MITSLALRLTQAAGGADRAPRAQRSRAALLIGLLTVAIAGAGPAEARELAGAFRGNAYGTYANVKAGPLAATLARSAFQGCPCNGTGGKTLMNETDEISVPGIVSVNKTISTAFTSKSKSTAQVQNTSTVQGFNLLGGLISADGINAVASVSATKSTITASSEGSVFKNLVVAGQHIPDDVPPNTSFPLPGIGSVTLNRIETSGSFTKDGQIQVDMIAIDVSKANGSGLPVGTKILVGHALAGYVRKEPKAVYNGTAFVAEVTGNIGNDLKNKIGRSAAINIDCQGTHGKTRTNSVGEQDVNGLLALNGGSSTGFGGKENDAFVSRMTASSAGLNLLGGLIKLDGLEAVAKSTLKNGVVTGSADGSGFSGLTIAGIGIPANLPPNSKLPIPGIGEVTVNEQIIGGDGSVVVNGLHISVTMFNLLGLPVGSELFVAHATSSVAPF
jgi:hypothetical protein